MSTILIIRYYTNSKAESVFHIRKQQKQDAEKRVCITNKQNKQKKKKKKSDRLVVDHVVYGSVLYTVELNIFSELVTSGIATVVQFVQSVLISTVEVWVVFRLTSMFDSVIV